ncbi:unnamed protein product [Haemonchus placei]|uniref:Uncharacterized protein n=1 Tax=Haemonchus placei TaxID=6290 RepID=A0A0N4WAG4_HAEPC|nr:unnamed protein product [Haemonchus placei]
MCQHRKQEVKRRRNAWNVDKNNGRSKSVARSPWSTESGEENCYIPGTVVIIKENPELVRVFLGGDSMKALRVITFNNTVPSLFVSANGCVTFAILTFLTEENDYQSINEKTD